MLRCKPTAITITSEDIISFEEARLRRQHNVNSDQGSLGSSTNNSKKNNYNQSSSGVSDPNDELKPLPGDKARIVRSREERIGVSRRVWDGASLLSHISVYLDFGYCVGTGRIKVYLPSSGPTLQERRPRLQPRELINTWLDGRDKQDCGDPSALHEAPRRPPDNLFRDMWRSELSAQACFPTEQESMRNMFLPMSCTFLGRNGHHRRYF